MAFLALCQEKGAAPGGVSNFEGSSEKICSGRGGTVLTLEGWKAPGKRVSQDLMFSESEPERRCSIGTAKGKEGRRTKSSKLGGEERCPEREKKGGQSALSFRRSHKRPWGEGEAYKRVRKRSPWFYQRELAWTHPEKFSKGGLVGWQRPNLLWFEISEDKRAHRRGPADPLAVTNQKKKRIRNESHSAGKRTVSDAEGEGKAD